MAAVVLAAVVLAGAGADLRSGFAAGFLIFFFAADLAVLLLFVLAVVRGDFLGPAFVTAACRERFDEVAAFARFLAAGVRDLVLAGDLRAGFLTMGHPSDSVTARRNALRYQMGTKGKTSNHIIRL